MVLILFAVMVAAVLLYKFCRLENVVKQYFLVYWAGEKPAQIWKLDILGSGMQWS